VTHDYAGFDEFWRGYFGEWDARAVAGDLPGRTHVPVPMAT
jgi:hypothetical protein